MSNSDLSLFLLASFVLFSSIVEVKPSPTLAPDQASTSGQVSAADDEMVAYGPPDQYPKLYANPEVDRFLSDLNRLGHYEGLKALDVGTQLGARLWSAAITVLMQMEPGMLEGFKNPEDSFNLAYERQFSKGCKTLLDVFDKHEQFLFEIVHAPPPVPYKAQVLYRLGLACRQLVTPTQRQEIYQHYTESSIHPDKNRWRFREQLNPK